MGAEPAGGGAGSGGVPGAAVGTDETQGRGDPAEAERDEDERDAEAQAVEEHQEGAAAGRPLHRRHRVDGGERRGQARRPGQAETQAEQRRSDEPGPRQPVDLEFALQEPDPAQEDDAHDDGDDAEHPFERQRVLPDRRAELAEERPLRDEHGAEPEHEQQRPARHPALAGLLGVARQPGDVGEVTGHEWQYAGREESDDADERGHPGSHDQGAALHRVREPGVGERHHASARSLSIGPWMSLSVSPPR